MGDRDRLAKKIGLNYFFKYLLQVVQEVYMIRFAWKTTKQRVDARVVNGGGL